MASPSDDTAMSKLDKGWFNCLITGLQLDPGQFQSRRPAALPQSDTTLWVCEDLVPPLSLVFDTTGDVRRFSDQYELLVTGLAQPEDRFRRDIGEDVYRRWSAHLRQLPPPTPHQLPALFRKWAILHAPEALQIGVSRLVQASHTVGRLHQSAAYKGVAARVFDFAGSMDDLIELGRNSSEGEFMFDSLDVNGDVTGTWAAGYGLGQQGLWMGSSPDDEPSASFAAAAVRVHVQFRSYVVWAVTPGAWYDSSFLNLVFSDSGSPPWPARGDINWQQFFGPSGSLRRLVAALVVLDGVDVTVVAEVSFDAGDQDRIRQASTSGLWPFYITSSGADAINNVRFGKTMTIETRVQRQRPVVIGDNVLDVARYLGHAGIVEKARGEK
jgi:hypothetical protein